jgi:hypothetical protein
MSDNRIAGFVTALLISPLVVVCCLGPPVLGSILGVLVGWLGGLGLAEVVGTALAAGLVVYGLLRWRRARVCRPGGATHSTAMRD